MNIDIPEIIIAFLGGALGGAALGFGVMLVLWLAQKYREYTEYDDKPGE